MKLDSKVSKKPMNTGFLSNSSGTDYARSWLRRQVMSAQEFVNLIEELVEIKVRHHAAMSSRSSAPGNREIARALAQMNVADRERLQHVKAMLVQTFESAEQTA